MKRIFAIISVFTICCVLSAQTYWNGARADRFVSIGMKGGVNFSKLHHSDYNTDVNYKLGYHIGVEFDINLCQSLSINSGAYFIQKGYKLEVPDAQIKVHDDAKWIEVPVLLSYRIPLSDATKFQLNLGPYFSYGLGGKQKMDYAGGTTEMDSFDKYDGLKRADVGLSYGCAVSVSQLLFSVSYENSLIKLGQRSSDDSKNRCISISMGYYFK